MAPKDTEQLLTDSYVFKYDPLGDNRCFYNDEISSRLLRSGDVFTRYRDESDVVNVSNDQSMFK